jgi:hypothetical protein
VLDSNIGRDTGYTQLLPGFPQSLQATILSSLGRGETEATIEPTVAAPDAVMMSVEGYNASPILLTAARIDQ